MVLLSYVVIKLEFMCFLWMRHQDMKGFTSELGPQEGPLPVAAVGHPMISKEVEEQQRAGSVLVLVTGVPTSNVIHASGSIQHRSN